MKTALSIKVNMQTSQAFKERKWRTPPQESQKWKWKARTKARPLPLRDHPRLCCPSHQPPGLTQAMWPHAPSSSIRLKGSLPSDEHNSQLWVVRPWVDVYSKTHQLWHGPNWKTIFKKGKFDRKKPTKVYTYLHLQKRR